MFPLLAAAMEDQKYVTEYNQEKTIWGWRQFVRSKGGAPKPQFTVLSFNVMPQAHSIQESLPYCLPAILKWRHRRENLLREIFSLKVDILCLQGPSCLTLPNHLESFLFSFPPCLLPLSRSLVKALTYEFASTVFLM